MEQGRVFRRPLRTADKDTAMSLNPFGTGQGLSTYNLVKTSVIQIVSIPLEQGGVFRLKTKQRINTNKVSIPLKQGEVFRRYCWFRFCYWRWVSIPLEQGGVFRPIVLPTGLHRQVSIPLEQGEVFRLNWD